MEDLRYNGKSKVSEIHECLFELPHYDIRKAVYRFTKNGKLYGEGGKMNRTYDLSKKINQKINRIKQPF